MLVLRIDENHEWKQVVRCCLENAASVAKTFLTSDVVVVEMNQPKPIHMKIPPSPYKVMSKPGSLSWDVFPYYTLILYQQIPC